MANWDSYTTVVAATDVDNLDAATEYYGRIFDVRLKQRKIQNY